jgi:hypothetical protein
MEHPAECSAAARDAVDALLVVAPEARCGAAHGLHDLRSLPFFADVPWDCIWDATPPEVLPPPPPPAAAPADDDDDDARWELGSTRDAGAAAAHGERSFAVDALRDALRCAAPAPPPSLPPWQLRAGEAVVRCGAAVRKRGVAVDRGRLTLTSAGRMALLPERGGDDGEACAAPLLLLRASCVRALDATHLALRCEDAQGGGGGADVFVELTGGVPHDAAQQWVAAAAAVVAAAHDPAGT